MVDFSINETGSYASSTFDSAQYSFIGMEVVKQIIEPIPETHVSDSGNDNVQVVPDVPSVQLLYRKPLVK